MITRFDLRQIFFRAWTLARGHAKRYGTTIRAQMSRALKEAWAHQRQVAADIADMEKRVRNRAAELIASIAASKAAPKPRLVASCKGGPAWRLAA